MQRLKDNFPPAASLAAGWNPIWNYFAAPRPVEKSHFFFLKKWTLICFIMVNITALMTVIIFARKIAEVAVQMNPEIIKGEDPEEITQSVINLVIGICFVGTIIEVILLNGILREDVCLSMTYVVLGFITTGSLVFQAFTRDNHWLWVEGSVAAIMTLVAMLYVLDLGKVQQIRRRSSLDVVYVVNEASDY